MRRIFHSISASIVVVVLVGPLARADQSTSTQPEAAASPSSGGKKPAAQKTAVPKKQEEQKLKPVVVTATKIEQPISEVGSAWARLPAIVPRLRTRTLPT